MSLTKRATLRLEIFQKIKQPLKEDLDTRVLELIEKIFYLHAQGQRKEAQIALRALSLEEKGNYLKVYNRVYKEVRSAPSEDFSYRHTRKAKRSLQEEKSFSITQWQGRDDLAHTETALEQMHIAPPEPVDPPKKKFSLFRKKS